MAIDLPEPVVDFLSAIGINWPDIDEDHVREFGQHVTQFASDLESNHGKATDTVSQVLQAYQGSSSQRLSEVWNQLTTTYLTPTLDLCNVLGTGAGVAADLIVAMKVAAIVQLVVMAVEFVIDQVLAAVTFGLAEAALVAIEEAGAVAVKMLEQQIEDLIISKVVDAALTPLMDKVDQLVGGMVFGVANEALNSATSSDTTSPGVSLDPDQMTQLIQAFHDHGDASTAAGQQFQSNVGALTFSEN